MDNTEELEGASSNAFTEEKRKKLLVYYGLKTLNAKRRNRLAWTFAGTHICIVHELELLMKCQLFAIFERAGLDMAAHMERRHLVQATICTYLRRFFGRGWT